MPRIKMVFDGPDQANSFWRAEVTASVRDSIRNAVREDHPLTYGTTYDNTDDVGFALDDYPLAAAWLFAGRHRDTGAQRGDRCACVQRAHR